MAKLLVIVAHPDDETLGCGGTIARRVSEGDEAYCLALADGVSSRYENDEDVHEEEIQERRESYQKACSALGIRKTWLKDFPDNRFDSVPLLHIVKEIERVHAEVAPDVVYTHFERDLNIDHRLTFQAVLTACRPTHGQVTREILSFENPSSTEWASVSSSLSFRPTEFCGIEKFLEDKKTAMAHYQAELRPYPHPRSLEAIEISAKHWGIVSGLGCAEAFMQVRKLY
ncbi:PIG-L family deacetylase [bacterium]|nr:PIG-L family deacetylase [bacterium]